MGCRLDATGATTPGVISLAYVPVTSPRPGAICGLHDRAGDGKVLGTIPARIFELGSPAKQVAPGQYQYTFTAKAPSGLTHRDQYGRGRWQPGSHVIQSGYQLCGRNL